MLMALGLLWMGLYPQSFLTISQPSLSHFDADNRFTWRRRAVMTSAMLIMLLPIILVTATAVATMLMVAIKRRHGTSCTVTVVGLSLGACESLLLYTHYKFGGHSFNSN